MISGGFQNFQHMLYGLPNGWLARNVDTSDILDGYRKRRKKIEELELEEEIAAQLLKKRQQNVVITDEIDTNRLAAILQAKLHEKAKPDELTGVARVKKIQMLLFAILMDD